MLRRWLERVRAWWQAPVLSALAEADTAADARAKRLAGSLIDLGAAVGNVQAQIVALGRQLGELEKAHNRLATEAGWRYDHTVAAIEDNSTAIRHLSLKAFGTEPPARQWREQRAPRQFTHAERQ